MPASPSNKSVSNKSVSSTPPAAHDETARRILDRFFSRVEPREHGDVYVVRKLPQELRATLNGLYSRSRHSMRKTFLDRLEKGLDEQGKSLASFADDLDAAGESPEAVLDHVLVEKAGKFLRTYAIDHGHNSLREGAVVQLAIENVSQLFTRFVQRERRASFEESSTRYISFQKEGHWRDPDVIAAGEPWSSLYEEALDASFDFYRESIKALRAHLEAAKPCPEDGDAKAWLRAIRAEAFDSARYLLTPAIQTKWGMIADARTMADVITSLVSHELEEFRLLGARIREEAEKEFPTLLVYANENEYLARTPTKLRAMADELMSGADSAREARRASEIEVELLSSPEDLEVRLLAGLLFEHATCSLVELEERIRALSEADRDALFERALEDRGKRDPVPEGFEGAGLCDYEVLVDFGAYRDIGRHRKGFQQQQLLRADHGYVVPELFDEAGLGERYRAVMDLVAHNASKLAERFPAAAQYVIPFGFLQRVRLQFDTRQMAYFCELRSAPEGHFSYRDVAIRMADELEQRAPRYAKWLRVCREHVFLGRIEAEEGRDARRKAREERAKSQGFEI